MKSSVPNTGIPKGREGLMQLGFGGLGLGIGAIPARLQRTCSRRSLHLFTPLDRKASPYLATDLGTAFNISTKTIPKG